MDRASDERAPLLVSRTSRESSQSAATADSPPNASRRPYSQSPISVLPVALLSALALAATAATQVYAYATLLCSDARHCDDDERRTFAGAVAIATMVANICALFSIRGFEAMSKRHLRLPLAIWILVRSLSVVALSLGVLIGHIGVAMSSQVFEGLASDNILHFNLNVIYVRENDSGRAARLIGSSLALYMIGISISPSISSLLVNFQASFLMAFTLFAAAFAYLFIFVQIPLKHATTPPNESAISERTVASWICGLLATTAAPARFLFEDYWRLSPGIALFLYNAVQSYAFSAILVHTSVYFRFSSRENGFLLTTAHIVASMYLFAVLFAAPRVPKFWRKRTRRPNATEEHHRGRISDAVLALWSLIVQGSSLLLFAFVRESWQVYAVSAALALGLAFPSFLKSYFVSRFSEVEKSRALAALAVVETAGSLIAPIVLGGLQTIFPGRSTFFVAAGGIVLAAIIFCMGLATSVKRGHNTESTEGDE